MTHSVAVVGALGAAGRGFRGEDMDQEETAGGTVSPSGRPVDEPMTAWERLQPTAADYVMVATDGSSLPMGGGTPSSGSGCAVGIPAPATPPPQGPLDISSDSMGAQHKRKHGQDRQPGR